ncbi:MAG: class I SAM-dependent methyltransferase [Candidatus Omnitrophica bacterium]|nr:class I SAM-dependent methyltransferase [Candidatus Omnitrophota bacterium]
MRGCILDVGSGLGNIAKYFNTENIDKVILSGRTEEMYLQLKNRFSHSEKCAIIHMDITDERCIKMLSSYRINVVTCLNVLGHIKDDVKALANMHRILGKKGILLPR